MAIRKQKVGKLYSQSAILTIGTILITVALFLFKVVFYRFSEENIYSEFITAYTLFLFYAIFGYMNVGNPLSNDAYKSLKDEEKSITEYLFNAIYLVLSFSFISSGSLAINLILLGINWQIILIFCIAMFLNNINLVVASFFRGIEKIIVSAFLTIIKGATKPIILLIFAYLTNLTAVIITFAFLLGEIVSVIISLIFIFIWIKKNDVRITLYKPNIVILRRYFFQCIPLVLISFGFQGFNSFLITLIGKFSESAIGSLDRDVAIGSWDVAVTFLSFFIAFFINIGLMLAANSDRFKHRQDFFKFLFMQIFTFTIVITIIYEIVAYFVTWDDYLLEIIFDLNGTLLAKCIMLILPAFPFLVIFYIITGYKQGKRQYFAISLASVVSFGISFLPGYFLTKSLGLDGALISMIIFSVILAVLVFAMTFPKSFEFRLESLAMKIIKKLKKEQVSTTSIEESGIETKDE